MVASINVDIQETDTGDGNFIWLVLINNKGNMLCFPEIFFLGEPAKKMVKNSGMLYKKIKTISTQTQKLFLLKRLAHLCFRRSSIQQTLNFINIFDSIRVLFHSVLLC